MTERYRRLSLIHIFAGAVIKEEDKDVTAWKEYLENVMKKRGSKWSGLYNACLLYTSNCLLHIPALAHEFGIEITGDTFDKLHRNARCLLDVRPAGKWPAECFYYCLLYTSRCV